MIINLNDNANDIFRDVFNESSSSQSSSSSFDDFKLLVKSSVLICLYFILLCFPIGLFIVTLKHYCLSRKKEREYREGLIPDERSPINSFQRTTVGHDRLWTIIFCFFFSIGILGRLGANVADLLSAVEQTDHRDSSHSDFTGLALLCLSSSFCCAAYIIVLGMWSKLYITVFQIRSNSTANMNGSISVPDLYSRDKQSKIKTWMIPCCLVLAVLLIIASAISIKYIDEDNPSAVDPSKIVIVVAYSILTVGYFVYAMLLLCLFRWRFRSRSACSTVTYVIILSLLLCVTFLFRVFIMLDPPKDRVDEVLGYAYYIICDIIPQILIILLYAKILTTSRTTSKSSRVMWASA